MKPQDTAKLALQFLARVDLKGGEVAAFVAVSNWLNSVIDERETKVPNAMWGNIRAENRPEPLSQPELDFGHNNVVYTDH